jgi:hypothetical protein
MTSPPAPPPPPNTKNPLGAAQKIVEELTGLPREQQQLAIRFALETLGLQASPAPLVATPHAQPQQPAPLHPASSADHSTDIRAFTAMKSPNSEQQFTAVVAYFYQFEARPEDRRETINAETMKEAARLAGRAQVSRWNMTLTNAKNAGYLDAVGSGNFKLSSVGENLVAITLPGNAGAAGGTTRKRTAKKFAKKKSAKKKKA